MNKIKKLLIAIKLILKNPITDSEKLEKIKECCNMIDEIINDFKEVEKK